MSPYEAGKAALDRGSWQEAKDHFEAALEDGDDAAAWEGLSWSIWWMEEAEGTIAARESAYRAYRRVDDRCGASRMAVWLANDLLDFRGDNAVAAGWLQRARRLLDSESLCSEHGWLWVLDGYYALEVDGDAETGRQRGREAAELGHRLRSSDLEAIGSALEGEALVISGRVEDGLRRIDEAGAIASGERFEMPVSPIFAQCILISACERLGDFSRVKQWCDAMAELNQALNGRHVIGVCRSAYGNVLTARGDWGHAEMELVDALENLEASRPGFAPSGLVRLAELRVRQGRLEEARDLFERAQPHPAAALGLGTLALQEGNPRAAAEAAERTLRRCGDSAPLDRVAPLELLVRAQAAAGDLNTAQLAFQELSSIVAPLRLPYLGGRLMLVGGAVALAGGDGDGARRLFEDAVDLFNESAAPYETALARLGLAEAFVQLDRADEGDAEAVIAREVFEALGAAADAERAARFSERDWRPAEQPGRLSPREQEILRLVAHGLSDAEIAERLVVSRHTVHRHMANIRAKLGLPSRAAAVAYAAREGLL